MKWIFCVALLVAGAACATASTRATMENAFESFLSGDIPALMRMMEDDAILEERGPLPWQGTYKGPEGLREYLAKFGASIEIVKYSHEILQVDEGRGYVRSRSWGQFKSRRTGAVAPCDNTLHVRVDVSTGKIQSIVVVTDHAAEIPMREAFLTRAEKLAERVMDQWYQRGPAVFDDTSFTAPDLKMAVTGFPREFVTSDWVTGNANLKAFTAKILGAGLFTVDNMIFLYGDENKATVKFEYETYVMTGTGDDLADELDTYADFEFNEAGQLISMQETYSRPLRGWELYPSLPKSARATASPCPH
jgi:ketosteroid isomerase-like protein